MTIPSTFSTPYRLIKNAMFNAKYLAKYQDPDSEDLGMYMPKLNDLFNTLQTQGLKLWLNQDFPITPIQGQNQYNLGSGGALLATKPTRVLEGYYTDQNNNRRPIIPLSRNEWDSLSTVRTQGTLTSYWVDKQQLTLNVYLWLTPDLQTSLGQFHAIIQYQVGNVVSMTDTMNFPVEWFLALEWGLSDIISTGQPQAVIDKCALEATKYLTMLENWDVEDASTFFTPDMRVQNTTIGRFNR